VARADRRGPWSLGRQVWHQADSRPEQPWLPFPGGAFYVVVASLVLHCLEYWTTPLVVLRRVPVPGGWLIAAVDAHLLVGRETSYLATHRLG